MKTVDDTVVNAVITKKTMLTMSSTCAIFSVVSLNAYIPNTVIAVILIAVCFVRATPRITKIAGITYQFQV